MKKFFMCVICVLTLNGCYNSIAVVKHEGLSRTYINIHFEKSTGQYESTRDVGGEHIDEYYFMVPANSTCEISISSIGGNASAYLSENDVTLWSTSGNTIQAQKYKIVGPKMGRLKLEVMAHPVDTYTLQIILTEKGS